MKQNEIILLKEQPTSSAHCVVQCHTNPQQFDDCSRSMAVDRVHKSVLEHREWEVTFCEHAFEGGLDARTHASPLSLFCCCFDLDTQISTQPTANDLCFSLRLPLIDNVTLEFELRLRFL